MNNENRKKDFEEWLLEEWSGAFHCFIGSPSDYNGWVYHDKIVNALWIGYCKGLDEQVAKKPAHPTEVKRSRLYEIAQYLRGLGNDADAAHVENCAAKLFFAAQQPAQAEPIIDQEYSIELDLEEAQQQLAEAENKVEQYEGFFIGEDGNSFDRDPEALINNFISRFGKPRTIPDAITASTAISSHYARGWNDYRQKIIEQIGAPRPPKAEPSEKLVHLGYTDENHIERAKNTQGRFYPDPDGGQYIPVYMLARQLNRLGPDASLPQPPKAAQDAIDLLTRIAQGLSIIEQSEGIAGWHMNGEVSPWDEGDLPGLLEEAREFLCSHQDGK